MPTEVAPPVNASLLARSRAPTGRELHSIAWLPALPPELADRARSDLRVAEVKPGELICRFGRPPTFWFGVIDGLLKMSNDDSVALPMTFTGVAAGGWFGEGTMLKREPYRYNVQALRASTVTGIPVETFHYLLDHSIAFNRFVMQQLNERLGQFIAAREIDRLTDPEARVARHLAALFNPVLYPGVGQVLRTTQQELGYLVGLSRQRVNEALHALQAERLIRIEYGTVRVLDLDRLRRYHGQQASADSGTLREASTPSDTSPLRPTP